MKRILIATDGSEGARSAMREGLELARDLGAVVTFVTVRPGPPAVLGEPYYQTLLSEELAKARTAVEQAMAQPEAEGIEADYEILEGDPADEILTLADNRDADLIVVGSRGLGPVAGALLGSVSRAIVQHAHRPVLVAKQWAPARPSRVPEPA